VNRLVATETETKHLPVSVALECLLQRVMDAEAAVLEGRRGDALDELDSARSLLARLL
jgi:hypothetical protein